jgi:hypothetical protein
MQTIAIRTYPVDDNLSDKEYVGRAYLYRKMDGSFILRATSNSPHELADETIYSLEQAFDWLCDTPHQIEVMDAADREESPNIPLPAVIEAIRQAAH